jgi:hypothetical protein
LSFGKMQNPSALPDGGEEPARVEIELLFSHGATTLNWPQNFCHRR